MFIRCRCLIQNLIITFDKKAAIASIAKQSPYDVNEECNHAGKL
jgi:hypothetical protein